MKTLYHVSNWPEYNKALCERGSLATWLDENALCGISASPVFTGLPGHPQLYSDVVITMILTLGAVYHQPLRQTIGLVRSLFAFLKLEVPVPDYTTLCRRRRRLRVALPASTAQRSAESVHVVVDSTGLKVYGDGEWRVRQHGTSKRRTWRKLHLATDENTGELLSCELTDNATHDGAVLMSLLNFAPVNIGQVSADGAYDHHAIHTALCEKNISATIPPRRDARIRYHGNTKRPKYSRDEILRAIRRHGRSMWKRISGYHRRSLAETMFFRYKTIFGSRLSARELPNQKVEAYLCCRALNRMTALGMPISVAIP